ncbi:hypothetical protein T4C_8226 [Trichinella pseudospiralis]|uniref:Uncharacterized protein n=1 Tax=Trichinella pseudospiralis TaxID=6337 RepID=A0A0V1IEM1_TRIPS|nr:hypothetical protein T4C_8226 [Trichinella pseudospiralis]
MNAGTDAQESGSDRIKVRIDLRKIPAAVLTFADLASPSPPVSNSTIRPRCQRRRGVL